MIRNQNENNDVILDFASLFQALWKDKVLIMLFVVLSIPTSIYFINSSPVIYKAEAILEIAEGQSSTVSNSALNSNLISIPILENMGAKSTSSFVPFITGEEFLQKLIERSDNLAETLDSTCGYQPNPHQGALRKLLVLIGISENRIPTEQQRKKIIIQCANGMIEVDEYSYEGIITPAYIISAKSENPLLASNLVNEMLDYYFIIEKKNAEKVFKKRSEFLMKRISEAAKAVSAAEMKHRDFTIENADMLGNVQLQETKSPLRSSINDKIFRLGQVERGDDKLRLVLEKLRSLKNASFKDIKEFVNSVGVVGGLSSRFVSQIATMESSSREEKSLSSLVSDEVSVELKKLNDLVKRNEFSRSERESELLSLLALDRKLADLEIDIESKSIYLSGLESKLTSVDLEAGLDQLKEGKVYTKASPPLYPISPNKKLILALCMTGFLALGTIIALFRQATKKTIFNLTQLAELRQLSSKFCISLKYNKNKFFFRKESLRISPFDLQFHSSLNQVSGKGCIVDISQENKMDGIRADTFTLKISEIIASSSKINVYINHRFYSGINKTLGMVDEQSVIEKKENKLKNIVINGFEKKDKDSIYFPSDVSLQKNDHCLVSLGESISDLDKYNMINLCDYYILIAQSGKVDLNTVQKFLERVEGDTNKCLAFFLII